MRSPAKKRWATERLAQRCLMIWLALLLHKLEHKKGLESRWNRAETR